MIMFWTAKIFLSLTYSSFYASTCLLALFVHLNRDRNTHAGEALVDKLAPNFPISHHFGLASAVVHQRFSSLPHKYGFSCHFSVRNSFRNIYFLPPVTLKLALHRSLGFALRNFAFFLPQIFGFERFLRSTYLVVAHSWMIWWTVPWMHTDLIWPSCGFPRHFLFDGAKTPKYFAVCGEVWFDLNRSTSNGNLSFEMKGTWLLNKMCRIFVRALMNSQQTPRV